MFYWDIVHIRCCSVAKSCRCLATPWTAANQAPLSSTISWSLLEFMTIELATLSNHLILYRPLLFLPSVFPSIRVFPNEWTHPIRWPMFGASASASVLPMNIQDLFPLGLTGLISLQSEGLSRVLSSNSFWKRQFFGAQPSLWPSSHKVHLAVCTWEPAE